MMQGGGVCGGAPRPLDIRRKRNHKDEGGAHWCRHPTTSYKPGWSTINTLNKLSLPYSLSLSVSLPLRERTSLLFPFFIYSLPSPPLPSDSQAKAQSRCRPSHQQQRRRQRRRQPGILEEAGSEMVQLVMGKLPTLPGPCPPPCGSQTVAVVVMRPGSG
jgi:hypothetical protein